MFGAKYGRQDTISATQIEEKTQLAASKERGCDKVQKGWFRFGQPSDSGMTAEERKNRERKRKKKK